MQKARPFYLAAGPLQEDIDVCRLRDQLAAHTCGGQNHVDLGGLQHALEGLGASMSIPELRQLVDVSQWLACMG